MKHIIEVIIWSRHNYHGSIGRDINKCIADKSGKTTCVSTEYPAISEKCQSTQIGSETHQDVKTKSINLLDKCIKINHDNMASGRTSYR